MPVYNGEKYIGEAIDSILNQTFTDFELIISDNASTDKTQVICEQYVKRDKRVSYHRNRTNIGAPRNYNHVFRMCSGQYFKWAAFDDVLAPKYLEKCVNVLNKKKLVVMCNSRVARIDENGVLVGNYDNRTLDRISSTKPHERFADMLSPQNTCWAIHAVIRSSCLIKTPLHGDYIDGDRNLLAEIALYGQVFEIPEHLFFRRDHPGAYTRAYYSESSIVCDYRSQLIWWEGYKRKRLLVLPHWKNCIEYFRSINRVPLKWYERLLCCREIGRWLLKENYGLNLLKWDLSNEYLLWRIKLHYGKNYKVAKSSIATE
jgi:glycosyltransferase involved in cell wall biosynthesis